MGSKVSPLKQQQRQQAKILGLPISGSSVVVGVEVVVVVGDARLSLLLRLRSCVIPPASSKATTTTTTTTTTTAETSAATTTSTTTTTTTKPPILERFAEPPSTTNRQALQTSGARPLRGPPWYQEACGKNLTN